MTAMTVALLRLLVALMFPPLCLLVLSLGLNVFLVVQYLSVQNQFRDLSNDLRDSFMSNNYE